MSQKLERAYTDEEKSALTYPCPKCRRAPGDRCVGPTGQRRPLHQARMDLVKTPEELKKASNIANVRNRIRQLSMKRPPDDPEIVQWKLILDELLEGPDVG